MSDSEIQFEEGENDFEVSVLEDGQEVPKESAVETKPSGRNLTEEEYAELMKRQDSVSALTQGFEKLGENLQRPQAVNVPGAPVGPTDDELEEMAFKPKGFAQSVRAVASGLLAQQQGSFNQAIIEQNKKMLKLDPATKDTFNRFEKEIERRVAALPPNFKSIPTIYEQVHRQVLFENQDTIINERAQAIADAAVKKALEAAGIRPKETGSKSPAMYQEGATKGMAAASRPVTKVYITKADVVEMTERGMDPNDKDQVDSFVRNVKSRRK